MEPQLLLNLLLGALLAGLGGVVRMLHQKTEKLGDAIATHQKEVAERYAKQEVIESLRREMRQDIRDVKDELGHRIKELGARIEAIPAQVLAVFTNTRMPKGEE